MKNAIDQLERNEWLLLSTFQQGLQQKLVFILAQENAFLYRFHFNGNSKNICSFKIGIFKSNPPFERLACFYETITGNFERFQYFNFEINFLKNTLFKKLEYHFLVESTKIDNITFPYKIALLRQIKWGVQIYLSQRTEFCQ